MTGRRCCCRDDGCTIASDSFSGSSLNAAWSGSTDAFSVADGFATVGQEGAWSIVQSVGQSEGVSEAIVRTTDTAQEMEVLIDYVDDSNYHAARLTIHPGPGISTLSLVDSGSVIKTHTVPDELSTNTWYTLRVCLKNGILNATVAGEAIADVVTPHGGTNAGVGANTSLGAVDFDEWSFNKHYDAIDEPDCPKCETTCSPCDTGTEPTALLVKFDDFVGCDEHAEPCGDLNGIEFYVPLVEDVSYGGDHCYVQYRDTFELSLCGEISEVTVTVTIRNDATFYPSLPEQYTIAVTIAFDDGSGVSFLQGQAAAFACQTFAEYGVLFDNNMSGTNCNPASAGNWALVTAV